ncbi:MAG: hypothetical protein CMI90_06755 [Pelagibacteraceae bacterium]|nr:hypothetical protein [Pelagibacteraceae bacterium]
MTKANNLKKTYRSLPLGWYYEENQFKKEIKNTWSRDWIYVGHENSIKEKLEYITINIFKYNILILRDKFSKVRAYFNTCSHRGSIIADNSKGKFKSNVLICPYHQWSYDPSDGSLLGTTSKTNKDFNKKNCSLTKIQLKIWNGLIFINLGVKTSFSIKKVFQYYDKSLSKIDLSKFKIGRTWKKKVNCNWKIYWENFSECLHCPNIHPELSKLVPLYQRRIVDIKDVENWKILKKKKDPKFSGGLREGAETWSFNGSAQGHYIENLKKEIQTKGQIYISTWPSMFLGVYGDHIRIVRILPISNEEIELSAEWLFEEKTLKDPKYDMNNVSDFGILVMQQDSDISELNQKGVYNLSNKKGTLMPEEYIIKDFHDWLRRKLRTN